MNMNELESAIIRLANRGRKPRGKRKAELETMLQVIRDETILKSDITFVLGLYPLDPNLVTTSSPHSVFIDYAKTQKVKSDTLEDDINKLLTALNINPDIIKAHPKGMQRDLIISILEGKKESVDEIKV